jgi:hypothetical protein
MSGTDHALVRTDRRLQAPRPTLAGIVTVAPRPRLVALEPGRAHHKIVTQRLARARFPPRSWLLGFVGREEASENWTEEKLWGLPACERRAGHPDRAPLFPAEPNSCFMVLGGGDGRGLNAMPTARLRARQCHIFVFVTL